MNLNFGFLNLNIYYEIKFFFLFRFKTSAEDLRTGMYKILEFIKNHDEAWPFVDPVDENYAPRYYSVIRKPMDLQRMEEKLDNGEYLTFNDFKNDFQLIVDNCRQYNGSENGELKDRKLFLKKEFNFCFIFQNTRKWFEIYKMLSRMLPIDI